MQINSYKDRARQAPQTTATFGIGLASKKPLQIKALTPREMAVIAFVILGDKGAADATIH